LFEVEDLSVACLSAVGVKGLALGTTYLTIRPFLSGPCGMPAGGAQARIVLKMTP